MRKLEGASFYEERLLFLLIRLRNPRARVVFVTSQPVHPLVLEYYFQLLVGIPTSHARSRLTLLCAHDASPRPLTEKILERPRLLERIRQGIADRARAYLTVFNSTPLERKLAVLLGIPLNGVDPALNVARDEVREPEDLSRGRHRHSRRLRGPARRPRHRDRARRAQAQEAGPEKRGRETERQLLGRGQRRLSVSRRAGRSRRSGPRDAPRRGVLGAVGDVGRIPREVSPDGRHRRGVHRGFLQDLTERPAPGRSPRRGHPDLHARPDPGRTDRPGFSRLPLSGRRRVSHAHTRRGPADRRRSRREGRREPLRDRLPR